MNSLENVLMVSPLHLLAYNGHRNTLEFLLKNKLCGDVDVKDINGRTPLDLACFQGESSCVKCLMAYGAQFDSHDSINERTPIHAAVYNNNEECLKAISNAEYDKLRT